MSLSTFTALAAALVAGSALASEPPRESLGEALVGAKVVFVARVVETKELERRPPYHLKGAATLVAAECLLGMKCTRGARLELRYTVLSEMECDPGADLAIGTEYVFVLRDPAPDSGPLRLVTCERGVGRDMVFQIASGAEDFGDRPLPIWSIWRGPKGATVGSMTDLRSWVRKAGQGTSTGASLPSCDQAEEAVRTALKDGGRCDRDDQCEVVGYGLARVGCFLLANRARTEDMVALKQSLDVLHALYQRGKCGAGVFDCAPVPRAGSTGASPFTCIEGRCVERQP